MKDYIKNYGLHIQRIADELVEHFQYWIAYQDFGKTERNKQRKMLLTRINRLRSVLDELEAEVTEILHTGGKNNGR